MSAIEKADEMILDLINSLQEEFGRTGWRAPTDERKSQIIKDISRLRASMVTTEESEK